MMGIPSESRNRMSLARLLVFLRVRLAMTASFCSFRFTLATSSRSAMILDAACVSIIDGSTGTRMDDESRVSSRSSS